MTTDPAESTGLLEAHKPCSELQKKDYVLLKGRPCEVKDVSVVETNDCQILVKLVAEDVLTGETMEDSLPYITSVDVPIVERRKYSVIDIKDGVMQLSATFAENHWIQLKVPEGPLGQRLLDFYGSKCNLFINTTATMGEEEMTSWTVTPKLPEHLTRERPMGPPVDLFDSEALQLAYDAAGTS